MGSKHLCEFLAGTVLTVPDAEDSAADLCVNKREGEMKI